MDVQIYDTMPEGWRMVDGDGRAPCIDSEWGLVRARERNTN